MIQNHNHSASAATRKNIKSAKSPTLSLIVYFGLHILLGIFAEKSVLFSTAHAYLSILIGIGCVLLSRKKEYVAYAIAYIVGAEVLWRATDASLLWEVGKYSIALISVLALMKYGFRQVGMPVLFFLLLLPSIVVCLGSDYELNRIRKFVSFALSGSFALTLCCLFFARMSFSKGRLYTMFLIMMGPLLSLATIVGTFARQTHFYEAKALEGLPGLYGPNQVAAVLGLGAFLVFLYIIDHRMSNPLKIMMYFLGVYFATRCALTFSRGGMYMATLAAVSASFFLVQSRKTQMKLIITIIIVGCAAVFVALPRLVTFTQGSITERFKETSLTGRETIFSDDMRIFSENMVLGVGPGLSRDYRPEDIPAVIAHTEFSRYLAEHGLFGLAATLVLLMIAFQYYKKANNNRQRAIVVSMVVWSMLHLLVYASRIVAPSFVFGLAALRLFEEPLMAPKEIKRKERSVEKIDPDKVFSRMKESEEG